MKQIKKMQSLLLAIAMIVSMCSVVVSAEVSYDTASGTDATVFGNSSFTWNGGTEYTSANAYDGTYRREVWGMSTHTATKTFFVEKTDEYELNVYAASSRTDDYASDMKFQIDDANAVTFHSGNSTVETLESPCITSGSWKPKNIKYSSNILLEKGLHTITFTFPQNSEYGAKRQEGIYTFDCAILTPANALLTVSDESATTIGNSSFAWSGGTEYTSANAYDGTYRREVWGTSNHTATKTFYVENSCEYALNVYAAASITDDYASDLKFQIDDGSVETFHSGNATVEKLESPCITNGSWTPKNIKYNNRISLEEGLHTITFMIPKNSEYGAKRTEGIYTFDCMTFIPIQSLDGVELIKDSYVLNFESDIALKLMNDEGKTVTFDQFDSKSIEFSEPTVALADRSMKITAKNKGYTEFKITAKADGTDYEFAGKIYVTDEKGIYITDPLLDTNQITLNVASKTEYSGGDKLIFAVFGEENGCATSLKTLYTQDIPAIGAEDSVKITQSISALGENDFVRIFIIDSNNKNRTLYGKVTLGLEDVQ